MKRLSKILLSKLEEKELTQREMKKITGGKSCSCGCCYEGSPGGSTTEDNGGANCKSSFTKTCHGGSWHTWFC
jgi:natural product precursor